ncbi:hypothetical protein JVT61DRAFT_58 [Boletus reticuloceps]|uniref:Uncharacterized protein n=1 Tax=Boletus reticuloceps TaxID=495285 RepID=A0A8I2Z290_9AGAM|nr:hypothetical protein JVT61DRAFT_58 [Boletus reticuloceps]
MDMRSSNHTKQWREVSPYTSRHAGMFHCTFRARPLTLLVLQGKERNFTHKALFAISAVAHYGNSQKLLGATPEFQKYVPEAAIVLIAAGVSSVSCSFRGNVECRLQIKSVLQSLMQHGKAGNIQIESGHIDKMDYEKLYGLIGDVAEHRDSGPRLQQQLEKWVEHAR